jgi:hypothetical protein
MDENKPNLNAVAKNLSSLIKEEKQKRDQEAQEFFENLSYDDQLKAFYHICRTIWLGELMERRTYRGVLYEMFKFGPDAYSLGMDCGFFDIHNNLVVAYDLDNSLDTMLKFLNLEVDESTKLKLQSIFLYGSPDIR